MSLRFNRRSVMRGLLGGSAICVGIPTLDQFLNGNGTAYAQGAKLPVRFGTYFWGLGLTDTPTGGTRWVPKTVGGGYEITPELESLTKVKDKVSVFSGFRAIGDGRANLVHWSGHASILSGVAPSVSTRFDGPTFDTKIADAIAGTGTRFKVLDVDASMSRKGVSYSTRTGAGFGNAKRCCSALRAHLRRGLPGPQQRQLETRSQHHAEAERPVGDYGTAPVAHGQCRQGGPGEARPVLHPLRDMENQSSSRPQSRRRREACDTPRRRP